MDFNSTAGFSAKAKVKVPFGTVSVTPKARELIHQALDANWVTQGPFVQEFEKKFAQVFGVKYAVAVSSGTDADAIACAVLYDFGARRGDEIIIPALTFVATANAVCQAGFTPVFVDVERETLNIHPRAIEKAITPRTKAIMPVHLMGKPAAMDEIMVISRKHHLRVIEDTAEAHGAEYKGRKLGTIGHMAAFSLYAAHIITSIEGGMIITDDERMMLAMKSLRNHGMVNKFDFKRIGFSSKMNELEAAVGLGNIEIFDQILAARRRNLLHMIETFKKFDRYFWTLKEEAHEKIGPHAFSIVLKPDAGFTKDQFVFYIESQGVDSRNLFYSIPTQCESYAFLGHTLGDFPEAEYCSDHGTHIGIHQHLELQQLDYVADVVEKFLSQYGQ